MHRPKSLDPAHSGDDTVGGGRVHIKTLVLEEKAADTRPGARRSRVVRKELAAFGRAVMLVAATDDPAGGNVQGGEHHRSDETTGDQSVRTGSRRPMFVGVFRRGSPRS